MSDYQLGIAPHLGADPALTLGEAERLKLPLQLRLYVEGGRLPFPVSIVLGRDAAGALAVTELHVESLQPGLVITTTALRRIGAALGEVLEALQLRAPPLPADSQGIAEYIREHPAVRPGAVMFYAMLARPLDTRAPRRGRPGHSDAFFRSVARQYAVAKAEDPKHPFTLLARWLYLSEAQARRLAKTARQRFPAAEKEGGGE